MVSVDSNFPLTKVNIHFVSETSNIGGCFLSMNSESSKLTSSQYATSPETAFREIPFSSLSCHNLFITSFNSVIVG